jgi:hypothetical protein
MPCFDVKNSGPFSKLPNKISFKPQSFQYFEPEENPKKKSIGQRILRGQGKRNCFYVEPQSTFNYIAVDPYKENLKCE